MKCEGNKFQIRVLNFTVIASYFISVEIIKALQVSQGQWMEIIALLKASLTEKIFFLESNSRLAKEREGP